MRDLGLELQDRSHDARQPRIDRHHLLKLVEDERDPATARGAELRRQLQKPLHGRVDVRRCSTEAEAEAERAVDGVERDDGLHA